MPDNIEIKNNDKKTINTNSKYNESVAKLEEYVRNVVNTDSVDENLESGKITFSSSDKKNSVQDLTKQELIQKIAEFHGLILNEKKNDNDRWKLYEELDSSPEEMPKSR